MVCIKEKEYFHGQMDFIIKVNLSSQKFKELANLFGPMEVIIKVKSVMDTDMVKELSFARHKIILILVNGIWA